MSETCDVLTITGQVSAPGTFTRQQLAGLDPSVQVDVSQLDPKRSGRAVTLKGLLEAVGPALQVQWLTLHAARDDFHASIPLDVVVGKAVLIYELNGQPLPAAQGGPFRFFVPDYLACQSAEVDECANVKFVDRLEFTNTRGFDNRPHDDAAHAALHDKEKRT